MFVEQRKLKNGRLTFSIRYRDEATGKLERIPQSQLPKFYTFDEAQAWAKAQEGIYAARKAAHLKKLEWKNKYYEFPKLLTLFTEYQQKRAPNSWESNVGYLENWVFHFFLNIQHMGNVNDWHLKFQEFRDWISSEQIQGRKGKKKGLSRNTQNNIIKTLNVFLTCLGEYKKIDDASVKKCKALPHDPETDITLDDIILPDECELVYKTMLGINKAAAEFFYVAWHTGMRFSEIFGLTIAGQADVQTLRKGELKNSVLHKKWARADIKYVGWIYLDSQPQSDICKRDADKSLPRKPLKWCPVISPKYARCIPIESDAIYKILANRFVDAKERFDKRMFTTQKCDYRYFEDLNWGEANTTLARAFEQLGIRKKSYHKCRHSFATFFKNRVGTEITMQVTGHRKIETLAKYDHINELLAMQARNGGDDEIQRVD